MKDSIVFYKSFYEAIKELPEANQVDIYNAIFQKYFYGVEKELTGISKGIFGLMVPNIDSANKRYFANVENGKKGGRPKSETKPNQNPIKTQKEPNNNLNDNVNDNDNVNVNDNDNVINCYQQNIGTISPILYEKITELEKEYGSFKVKQAITRAVQQNIRTFNYIKGILTQWGDKSWEEILKEDEIHQKGKRKSETPEWLHKEIKSTELTEEEQKELDDLLKEFKNES